MRQPMLILAALAAVLGVNEALPARAAITVQKDSALFNAKYEMDVLPTDDDQGGPAGGDWQSSFSPNQEANAPFVQDGIMAFSTNLVPSGSYEFNNFDLGAGISFATGYTIEVRAQFPSSFAIRTIGIVGVPGGGHNDQLGWMSIGDQNVFWRDIGPVNTGQNLLTASNSDDFHVFRFAQEAGVNSFSVWRDGVLLNGTLVGADLGLGAGNPLEKLAFGKEAGDYGGTALIDYVRFDSTGAFAPVSPIVVIPGDYNGNGAVDAADYVVWRKGSVAADGTGPSGTPDGIVDSLDYDFWKARFGNTSGSGSVVAAAVPEPSSLVLTLVIIVAAVVGARRNRQKQLAHSMIT